MSARPNLNDLDRLMTTASLTDEHRREIAENSLDAGQVLDSAFALGEVPVIYDLSHAQTERAGRQPLGFQIQTTESEGDE